MDKKAYYSLILTKCQEMRCRYDDALNPVSISYNWSDYSLYLFTLTNYIVFYNLYKSTFSGLYWNDLSNQNLHLNLNKQQIFIISSISSVRCVVIMNDGILKKEELRGLLIQKLEEGLKIGRACCWSWCTFLVVDPANQQSIVLITYNFGLVTHNWIFKRKTLYCTQ